MILNPFRPDGSPEEGVPGVRRCSRHVEGILDGGCRGLSRGRRVAARGSPLVLSSLTDPSLQSFEILRGHFSGFLSAGGFFCRNLNNDVGIRVTNEGGEGAHGHLREGAAVPSRDHDRGQRDGNGRGGGVNNL